MCQQLTLQAIAMLGITVQEPLTRQSNSLPVRVSGLLQVPQQKKIAPLVLITHIQHSHLVLSALPATTVMKQEWTHRKTALWDISVQLASLHTLLILVLCQHMEHRRIFKMQVNANHAPQENTVRVRAKQHQLVTVLLDTTATQIQPQQPLLVPLV